MRIFLVGFMSAGKTTIGRQLARELNLCFYDLDQLIEKKYNESIKELFMAKGEEFFRIAERQTLMDAIQLNHAVISTGGGTPCFFDNMKKMNSSGFTFYLKLPIDILVDRLIASPKKRPLTDGKTREELRPYIEELLNTRKEFYEKARFSVDASNRNAIHYMLRILSGHMY